MLTEEQARSYALLTDPDVGLGTKQAYRLAAQHSFEWILRQTFAWKEDLAQGKVEDAGAIVSRLDRRFAPGALTPRDRASDLYRRHASEWEDLGSDRKNYIPDEFANVINS